MTTASTDSPVLRAYLGRLRPHLPLRTSRDILMELESDILDRVDALAERDGRDPDDEMFRHALEEIGEPEVVAQSYVRERYLVAPEAYRTFLLATAMVFGVHIVLVGIATALGHALHFGPVGIAPVGPHGLVSVLASAIHAVLLDIGITAVAFGVAGALNRNVRPGTRSFAVQATPRQAGGRALLAVLAIVVMTVFRDSLFVVVSEGRAYPLATAWTAEVMPLITAAMVGAVVKDGLYAILGERKTTLGIDAIHGAAVVALTLYLLGGDALLEVPAVPGIEMFRAPVSSFFEQLGSLVLAAIALLAAMKTMRRCVRLAQL